MSDYSTTKSRIFQWIGIVLVLAIFAGAYWYFQVRASTLNQSKNDLVTNGLVLLWSFNGDDTLGGTASDRSGNGLNGLLTNNPTKVGGKISQAIDFDGANDYVSTSDNSLLDVGTSADVALSGWFNRESFTTDDTIIAKRNGITAGDTGYILYIDDATDQLIFEVSDGTDEYSLTSVATFTTAGWNHFVVVWDQDSASGSELYINGVANTATDAGTIGNIDDLSNALAFRTGAESDDGNPFDGKLDEIREYNRTLAVGEIQSLYDQGGGTKVNSAVSNSQGTGRLDSGLAGYWALDNGSGTSATDSSTNGNTGTLTNGPTWGTGQIVGAVTFDGINDEITTTTDQGTGAQIKVFTLSSWFKTSTASGAKIIGLEDSQTGTGTTTWDRQIWMGTDGKIRFGVYNGYIEAVSTAALNDNTWHHAVGVSTGDNGTIALYVDGVLQQTTNIGGSIFAGYSTSYWRIGGYQNSPGWTNGADGYFTGSLDEVRVYNRALAIDEVSQLYRLTTPTSVDTSLKGYWSFNGQDISGATAYDRSGVGNSGTLTSGPTKVKGVIGQALDFDGTDDYITITDADDTKYVGALTLCTWAKVDTGSTYNHFMGKHSGAGGSQNPFDFRTSNDAIPKLSLIRSNTTHIGWEGPVVTIGQWKHYCVTAPSTIQTAPTFYINGMPTTGITTGGSGTGAATGSASAIRIGVRADDAAKMDGSLDEVRIYNRILTTSEIQSLYNQGNADSVNSSASQAQGTGRLDSALALYWALDDGTSGATPTSATDSSTNGNTGTLTNSPTWTTGQVGNAVDFDGTDDYVTVADADIFDVLDSAKFTLSGWFNRDTFTTDDTITAKSNGQTAADTGYNAYIDDSTDKLTFVANDGTDQYKLESTSTFTATGWHHYALVWNESGASQTDLYIDGVAENATATGTFANVNSMANSVALRVGAESDAGNPFDGKLDEIRLYRRAFSSDEVANLYRLSTPTAVDTGLKGYWSFNGRDMNGTTVLDSSGTGNFGTLTNGPTRTIGKIGQAIDFDGTDDYAELADNDSLDIGDTDSLTLVGWFNRQSATTVDVILAKRNTQLAASVGYYLNLESSSDGLLFEVSDGTDEYSYESTTTFTTPGWHHFAVVWDPNSAANSEIYVDGVDDNATDTGTIGNIGDLSNTRPIAIGSNSLASGQCDCLLDEIRVYKRALSAAEIAALYNQSR